MNIDQAAEKLQSRLERFPWLTTVGVGEIDGKGVLYVYLSRASRDPVLAELRREGWMGYRVLVEKVGAVRPIKV